MSSHLAIRFAAPLTRLDTEGRYRELFMELREMRQDGNWLDVNGAFFFEKYLRHRATRLGDDVHIEIRLIPGQDATCAAPRTATITTNTLPRWINDGCQFQLTLGNRSINPSAYGPPLQPSRKYRTKHDFMKLRRPAAKAKRYLAKFYHGQHY